MKYTAFLRNKEKHISSKIFPAGDSSPHMSSEQTHGGCEPGLGGWAGSLNLPWGSWGLDPRLCTCRIQDQASEPYVLCSDSIILSLSSSVVKTGPLREAIKMPTHLPGHRESPLHTQMPPQVLPLILDWIRGAAACELLQSPALSAISVVKMQLSQTQAADWHAGRWVMKVKDDRLLCGTYMQGNITWP